MTGEPAAPLAAGDDGLTAWQRRTLDRSLDDARRRALGRSSRFVEAANDLLRETGGFGFTVQDVVDRSGMSLRSFYQAFAGKDDLLLALFEDAVADGAAREQKLIADIADPVERLRACLVWLGGVGRHLGSGANAAASRALTIFHLTLASTRPDDLGNALEPQLLVLLDSVELGMASGQIRTDIPARRLAEILMYMALTAAHHAILSSADGGDTNSLEELWAFCLGGLLRPS